MSLFKWRNGSAKEHYVVANYDAYQDGALARTERAVYEQHLKTCREYREWVGRRRTWRHGWRWRWLQWHYSRRLPPPVFNRTFINQCGGQ